MKLALIIAFVVLWIIMLWCIMLMSPKGWIWLWIGSSVMWWNEYWSKKSIEWKLKIIALIASIGFVLVSLSLPFVW